MPNGTVVSIVDILRESRIQSLIKQLGAASDRIERRMLCARLECELRERSPQEVQQMERRMGLA